VLKNKSYNIITSTDPRMVTTVVVLHLGEVWDIQQRSRY